MNPRSLKYGNILRNSTFLSLNCQGISRYFKVVVRSSPSFFHCSLCEHSLWSIRTRMGWFHLWQISWCLIRMILMENIRQVNSQFDMNITRLWISLSVSRCLHPINSCFWFPFSWWDRWYTPLYTQIGVSKNRGTPKWMVKIMENPIKMDDLEGKPTIFGNIQMAVYTTYILPSTSALWSRRWVLVRPSIAPAWCGTLRLGCRKSSLEISMPLEKPGWKWRDWDGDRFWRCLFWGSMSSFRGLTFAVVVCLINLIVFETEYNPK